MKIFNYCLQGHEATTGNAIGAARGLDWQSIETQENTLKMINLDYFDTINGVEIYKDFASDSYLFFDAVSE